MSSCHSVPARLIFSLSLLINYEEPAEQLLGISNVSGYFYQQQHYVKITQEYQKQNGKWYCHKCLMPVEPFSPFLDYIPPALRQDIRPVAVYSVLYSVHQRQKKRRNHTGNNIGPRAVQYMIEQTVR